MSALVHRHPRRHRLALAVGALAIVAGTVACSDDEPAADDAAATTTSAQAEGSSTTAADAPAGETPGGVTETTLPAAPADIPVLEGREKEYADAMVSTYDPERDQPFQPEHVQCLANTWVPIVGVARFEAAGLEPGDLSSLGADMSTLGLDEATATALVDAMPSCNVDLTALVLAPILSSATPEQRACIDGALTAADLRQTIINQFRNVEDDAVDAAFEEAAQCMMPTTSAAG